ncbi:uncharacterized protein LOC115963141 [Quercus lobata]|uniref:Calmodulin-binding domain-containing protein n=1 Tax=Quercus lobata TaxID=97700 RepID=A0A7N2RBR8_QUELO|nr:uncharacterized protein LOC115963141 [Quercus lobata]XP_030937896.1 uncharacterized protein LOC115963141 [Quercus lobata]XP_030937897.1 uncharacterized protein LOC115963141 [Quercus lobata]XP_030937898.1 uncharacterized protein LOC115963141 [Quercus lobata]
MAEESTETPLTPEKTEAERGCERRRNSTGRLDNPIGDIKIRSRYLCASTGSCHDACKYGTKPALKPWSSFPKRVTTLEGEIQSPEKAATSIEGKKKSAIGRRPSLDSKVQKPSNPVVIKGEVSSSTKKETATLEKVPTSSKEIDVSIENASNQKPKHRKSKSYSHPVDWSFSFQRNNEIRISKEPQGDSASSRKSKILSNELSTSKIGEKKASIPHTVNLFPKHSVKGVSNMKTKNENSVTKVKPNQPSDVPEKTLYVIEAGTENKTVEPSQSSVSSSPSSVDKSLKQAQKGILSSQLPYSSKKNNLRHTGTGFDANKLRVSSYPSFGKKSLTHAQYGTHRAKSSSSPSSSSHSKENGAKITGSEDQKLEFRSSSGRDGMVSSEVKGSPAQNLKFRRGKVVELQSENSNSRRLKFKRVRSVGEIQYGKDHTRNWSKEVDDGKLEKDFERDQNLEGTRRRNSKSKEVGDSEDGTEIKSEEVVLRHQNVEEKKDTQSLYNNVIEETASKLVMARKSKVKALVGAFETVISLQDTCTQSSVNGEISD